MSAKKINIFSQFHISCSLIILNSIGFMDCIKLDSSMLTFSLYQRSPRAENFISQNGFCILQDAFPRIQSQIVNIHSVKSSFQFLNNSGAVLLDMRPKSASLRCDLNVSKIIVSSSWRHILRFFMQNILKQLCHIPL